MSTSLGTFIVERRLALGLTQEQLAERIGDTVRQAEVSRLENNRITLPRRQRMERLALALEVSLGELLVRSGWMQEGDDLVEAIAPLPQSWAPADLEALDSADPEVLIGVVTRAEALLAEATEALVRAEQSLASLQQLLLNVHNPRGGIHPKVGVVGNWESWTVFTGL